MGKRGFTLIELMIVMGILAILLALLIPNFIRARSAAMLSSCEGNMKNEAVGIEMYSVDNQGHFPANLGLLNPTYVKLNPTCPAVGTDTYTASYTAVISPDAYTFFCQGNNHITSGLAPNLPQYVSSRGLIVP